LEGYQSVLHLYSHALFRPQYLTRYFFKHLSYYSIIEEVLFFVAFNYNVNALMWYGINQQSLKEIAFLGSVLTSITLAVGAILLFVQHPV